MKLFAKLDKLTPREKMGFTLMGVAIFALLMDHLILQPVVKKSKFLDAKIENEEMQLNNNLLIIKLEDKVNAEYQEVSGLLAPSVSDDESINEMKGEIDDLAKLNDVKFDSINHREPKQLESYGIEYYVEIGKFEANLKSLAKFLNDIRAVHGMLRVVKLNISPGKSGGVVTGSMLITKVMKQSEVINPPESPLPEEDVVE